MRNDSWLTVAVFGTLALACGDKKEPAPAAPEQATAKPAVHEAEPVKPADVAAAPKGAAPSSIEEAGFSLRLTEAGPYKAGELSRFVLKLEPRGVFHINQEYPIEISLTGDADTSFPKASLARADAAQFDDKTARFEVPFTPKAAGDRKLMANVKFAVCTEENCVPDERDLALAVAVK